MSVLISAGTLCVIYATFKGLARSSHDVAVLAVALAGFTPQFLQTAASVNNDALVIFLVHLDLWVASHARSGATARSLPLLGALCGLTLLTKLSGAAVLPALGVILLCGRWSISWLRGGILFAIPAVGIGGAWFVRNGLIYGDPTAHFLHSLYLTNRSGPLSLAGFLRLEAEGFCMSYWAVFGQFSIILTREFYRFFAVVVLAGAAGMMLYLGREWRRLWREQKEMLVLLLWPVLNFLVFFYAWDRYYPASHGRFMFPAIGSISFVLALGILELVPRRGAAGAGRGAGRGVLPGGLDLPVGLHPAGVSRVMTAW